MEILEMSRRERKRLEVMSQVKAGRLRLSTASELLGISYRQAKRIWRRYQSAGDSGQDCRILFPCETKEKAFQDVGGEACAVAFAAKSIFHGSVRGEDGHCQLSQHG
jgi:hypothetical protein